MIKEGNDLSGNFMTLDSTISRLLKNPSQRNILAMISIGLAIFTAVSAWDWWVGHDRPNPVERPHTLMWDAISLHLRATAQPTAPGINHIDDNPLIRAAAWCLDKFGDSYVAVTIVQLPFLVLLLISTALLAWRLGGAFAAAFAPWIALFCPATLGLALHLDDLLAMQALSCTGLAMIAWADMKKYRWAACFAFLPIILGVYCSVYTNGLLMLMVFGITAGALIAWQWADNRQSKDRDRAKRSLWLPIVGTSFAGFAGLYFVYPFPLEYISEQAAGTQYGQSSALSDPRFFFAYPLLWYKLLAGSRMALLAFVSAGLLLRYKKFRHALFLSAWLFVPMALLTLFSKKHDWYVVATVPATYIIIALGLAAIPKLHFRLPVLILTILVLFGAWGAIDDSPNDDLGILYDAFYRNPKSYLFSPKVALPDWATLGKKVAVECKKRNLPVLFANGFGINGMESFYLWHADPSIPVLDLRWGPDPKTGSFCIAAKVDPSKKESATIKSLLDDYKKFSQSNGFFRTEQKTRLQAVTKASAGYKLILTHNDWVVFGPAE